MVGPVRHARSEVSRWIHHRSPNRGRCARRAQCSLATPLGALYLSYMTEPPDSGLRKILTWTFIALVVTILLAIVGVSLAIRFFDPVLQQ
jgi:hypothetical protein